MTMTRRFAHCDPMFFLRMVDFDREVLAELAAMFVETAPRQMRQIEAAAVVGDSGTLGDRVHALKGSLSIFHANPALHIVERIERHAREHPGATPEPLVAGLGRELAALCDELAVCADPQGILVDGAGGNGPEPHDVHGATGMTARPG